MGVKGKKGLKRGGAIRCRYFQGHSGENGGNLTRREEGGLDRER